MSSGSESHHKPVLLTVIVNNVINLHVINSDSEQNRKPSTYQPINALNKLQQNIHHSIQFIASNKVYQSLHVSAPECHL